MLKIFLNNKNIPLIPPSFHSNLINSNSELPKNLNHVTDRCPSSVKSSAGDIGKIIQKLDSNKEHGHDNISMRMLKTCGDTINKLSELIFKRPRIKDTHPPDSKKG